MRGTVAILREALASAWSQPIASIVTITMVAGMCATVLLTTGRAVGAEQNVLSSIDSAGTRSIVVRADPGSGLDSSVLDRIAHIDGVEWAGAFGVAHDVQNAGFLDGTKVPLRSVYSSNLAWLGVDDSQPPADNSVVGSALALEQLGMVDQIGGLVASGTGMDYALVGTIDVPQVLDFLEPMLLATPTRSSTVTVAPPVPVSVLVIIADRPDLVSPVSDAVFSVLAVDDPTLVKVSTSKQLAALRALVEGQLGSFGRSLVLGIFAVTALLVAAILYALVMLRRKDFGRRRALGASQGLIVALLLTQVSLLSSIGATVGCAAAATALIAAHDPLPPVDFFIAVAVSAVSIGLLAAFLPALIASRRDPLKELRVP